MECDNNDLGNNSYFNEFDDFGENDDLNEFDDFGDNDDFNDDVLGAAVCYDIKPCPITTLELFIAGHKMQRSDADQNDHDEKLNMMIIVIIIVTIIIMIVIVVIIITTTLELSIAGQKMQVLYK